MPAVIRAADDRESLLLGLVENVAREDLSPIEEARAFAIVLDEFGLSLGELSDRVGKSKPAVSNRVRLLELPEDVLKMIERGQLTEGHARAVLACPTMRAAGRSRGRSCRRGCRFAPPSGPPAGRARRRSSGGRRRRSIRLAGRAKAAADRITGFSSRIVSGRLEIPFADETELEELVEALERAAK